MAKNIRPEKKVLVDYEEKMSLARAAEFLETIATKLKNEQSLTLTHGGETIEITPSSQVELEVKLEERAGKYEFEIELEWNEHDTDKGLEIN